MTILKVNPTPGLIRMIAGVEGVDVRFEASLSLQPDSKGATVAERHRPDHR